MEKVRLSVGDTGADDGFTVVYRETYPMLIRVGFLLTGSNEIAEDLVQDVFERSRGADRRSRLSGQLPPGRGGECVPVISPPASSRPTTCSLLDRIGPAVSARRVPRCVGRVEPPPTAPRSCCGISAIYPTVRSPKSLAVDWRRSAASSNEACIASERS